MRLTRIYKNSAIVFLLALSLALPAQLFAGENSSATDGSGRLKYNLELDLTVIAVSTAAWAATEGWSTELLPSECRWCGVNSFDNWGHKNLKWSNTHAASMASHVTAFSLAPMLAFGLDAFAAYHDGKSKNIAVDALVIAEAATVSALVCQIVKISAARERPETHYAGPGFAGRPENNSFYSGHTSLAFSLAVSSGTVASMHGYRLAPVIWGAGLAVAATTGYLRVAADKHYLTDVIAGAVIGSAFGFGIPYFFHKPLEEKKTALIISPVPANGGAVLNISGVL